MNSRLLAKMMACASATLALMMMASCSPKVITSVTNPLPATDAAQVKVYDEGAVVPNSAQVIGQVKVTDGGFVATGRCRYPQVLEIARQQTAKAGGNGLFVRQHLLPDGHSTCHRITCDMLHLTDSIVDPTQANPLMEQAAEEERAYYAKQDRDNSVRQLPLNYIGVSGGYSWLDNDMLTNNGFKKLHPKGYDFTMEYSHLWRSKSSVRPLYLGFAVNGIFSGITYDDGYYLELHNTFLGAGFKMAYKTNKGFVWDYVIGMGYAHTNDADDYNNASGFGSYAVLDIGYLIGKHFLVGVSMVELSTIYPKPDFWPYDRRFGIDNGGINLKVGYSF